MSYLKMTVKPRTRIRLAEQLPAMIDLCRLIEEKLKLERALAERERLALLGQMAASISHNLKNPLGSIKTILQLQLESPELPDTMRRETQMVLDENYQQYYQKQYEQRKG